MPKLVARTSLTPWVYLADAFPVKKSVDSVGKHPISGLWNNPHSDLRQEIIKAMKTLDWTLVDIIRAYLGTWNTENLGPRLKTERMTDLADIRVQLSELVGSSISNTE
jgi:hypothetical protein